MKTLYLHNPRCSKSRQGLELIKSNGINHEVIEYLKNPLKKSELSLLFDLLSQRYSWKEFTRVKEKEFNQNTDKMTKTNWIKLIIGTPKLIERPILFNDKNAVIGRPPENLLSF
tara:strand:- start:941 stop:1282 length:342 start_codon:yes stop_codon:yes gene_type:complete